jgi:hypothetical protein
VVGFPRRAVRSPGAWADNNDRKYCLSYRKGDLEKVHQDHFTRFLQLVQEHDPEGKFANAFTRRIFRD